MTTILLLIAIILLSVAVRFIVEQYDKQNRSYHDWHEVQLMVVSIFAGIGIFMVLLLYLPCKKGSEIEYAQLLAEKTTIEQVLASGVGYDRIALNELIIDYNNRVISAKEKSQYFFIGDFYSNDVDWHALELIEWSINQ